MCEHLVDMALVLHSTSCNDCTNNCLKPIHRNVHTNTAMLFYAFVRSNSESLCAENLLFRHHGEQIEKWLLPPHSHGFFNNKPMYLYVRMAYFRSTIRNRLLSCVHCVCVCSGSWKSNVCSRQFECQDQLVRVLLLNIRPLHNAHVWISQLNTVDHTHTHKKSIILFTQKLWCKLVMGIILIHFGYYVNGGEVAIVIRCFITYYRHALVLHNAYMGPLKFSLWLTAIARNLRS